MQRKDKRKLPDLGVPSSYASNRPYFAIIRKLQWPWRMDTHVLKPVALHAATEMTASTSTDATLEARSL